MWYKPIISRLNGIINVFLIKGRGKVNSFFGITNCAFLILQIMHAGIIVLSEIIYCAVKWLKFTSEILIIR